MLGDDGRADGVNDLVVVGVAAFPPPLMHEDKLFVPSDFH